MDYFSKFYHFVKGEEASAGAVGDVETANLANEASFKEPVYDSIDARLGHEENYKKRVFVHC